MVAASLVAHANAQQRSYDVLVWPKPPERPRIQYMYAFSGKQDLGVERSFWQKLADVVFGEEKETGRLVRPQGVAVDGKGRIYVADVGAKGVHVFDFEEKEYRLITGSDGLRLVSPVGVAISSEGLVYVSDSELGSIIAFDEDGDVDFSFKSGLVRPTGIVLSSGLLYVADAKANLVIVFDLKGNEKRRFGKRGVENG